MAAILALLVLLLVFPFWGTIMLQGVAMILEIIWIVVCSLWRIWRVDPSASQRTPAGSNRSVKPPPKPKAARKPIDPRLQKTREMQVHWQHQGHRVGLVNLETGEVYDPAGIDDEKGGLESGK